MVIASQSLKGLSGAEPTWWLPIRTGFAPKPAEPVSNTAPSPWWCELPTWLLTKEASYLCQFAGLTTDAPIPPVPYTPGPTPADVISAQAEAQRRAAQEEAARLAAAQQAQIDYNRWRFDYEPEEPGNGDLPEWLLWLGLGVGAVALVKVVS